MGCLSELVVGITAGNQEKSIEVMKKVVSLGGSIWERNSVGRVIPDVLVADTVVSEAYNYCANLVAQRVEIVTVQWVEDCFKQNRRVEFQQYICPPFLACEICVTSFGEEEKGMMKKVVEQGGGIWSPNLVLQTATHLICGSNTSEKYEGAKQTNRIFLVTKQWLYDSIHQNKRLDESLYQFGRIEGRSVPKNQVLQDVQCLQLQNQLHAQSKSDGLKHNLNQGGTSKQQQQYDGLEKQLTKNQAYVQQNQKSSEFSFQNTGSLQAFQKIQEEINKPQIVNSDVPKIQQNVIENHGDTNNAGSPDENFQPAGEDPHQQFQNSLLWAKFTSFGLNNDEEIIFMKFLCTYGGYKLPVLPNSSLHPEVTHVIVNLPSTTPENFAIIENHFLKCRAQIISYDWVIACDREQKVIDEEQFELALEQLRGQISGNSNLVDDQNLLHNTPSCTDSTTMFGSQNNFQEGKPFFQLHFTLSALKSSQEQQQARTLIKEGGGTLINNQELTAQKIKSLQNVQVLAVTPAGLPQQTVQRLRKKYVDFQQVSSEDYVTIFWLKECVSANARMEWKRDSENMQSLEGILYRPVGVKLPIKQFAKLGFSSSKFQVEEVGKIEYLVCVLGGKFTEHLRADENTHLVIQRCEGEKYEYARRMNITVVTKEWLLDCYCRGHVVHIKDKSIYRPTGYTELQTTSNTQSNTQMQKGAKRSHQSVSQQGGGSQLVQHKLIFKQGSSKAKKPRISLVEAGNVGVLTSQPFVGDDENTGRRANRNSIASRIQALEMTQTDFQPDNDQHQQAVQIDDQHQQAVLIDDLPTLICQDGDVQQEMDVDSAGQQQQTANDMGTGDISRNQGWSPGAAAKRLSETLGPVPDSFQITQSDQVVMPPPPALLPRQLLNNPNSQQYQIIPGDEFQSQIINTQRAYIPSTAERYHQLRNKGRSKM